ncbi:Hypothetical_protein [Hexamita inflata]|uniref:Hypothetical_protein n=1 Tax=Hexamita inflata TaxID=28002 RepID=A0AA86U7U2_9EUKA|nr:Hypothetical protein HINF_LOCUS34095 [Hexamita inflata]
MQEGKLFVPQVLHQISNQNKLQTQPTQTICNTPLFDFNTVRDAISSPCEVDCLQLVALIQKQTQNLKSLEDKCEFVNLKMELVNASLSAFQLQLEIFRKCVQ